MINPKSKNNFSLVTLNTLFYGIIWGIIYYFQYYFPVIFSYFVSEDGWAECSTFVFYFMASLTLLSALIINNTQRRPGYVLLCIGLFFIAMEEISWGQRIFNIQTPHFLAEHNDQSELNLHNLSFLPAEQIFYYIIAIWAICVPLINNTSARLGKLIDRIGIPLVPIEFQPYFMLSAILFNSNIIIYQQEIVEMIMGLTFAVYTCDLLRNALENKRNIAVIKIQVIGSLIIIAFGLTFSFMQFIPSNVYHQRYAFNVIAKDEYPKRGMLKQAEKVFEYISNNKILRDDTSLYHYGKFLENINAEKSKIIFLQALEEIKGNIQLNPNKPKLNLLAARLYQKLNQENLAKIEFNETLRKGQVNLSKANSDWEKINALKSIAGTYIELNEPVLARKYLQMALTYPLDGVTKLSLEKLLLQINPDNK